MHEDGAEDLPNMSDGEWWQDQAYKLTLPTQHDSTITTTRARQRAHKFHASSQLL